MIYGSVCSGIEAATVAWHPLGWRPAFFAEIDKFPSAVLAHRFPEVMNLGDFTKIGADAGPIDLLVGGTPCQSFSVAGKRLGLDDPRGNLALEFLSLARRLRARWIVWENVPGVLSSNTDETDGDGDIRCGLAGRRAGDEWIEESDFATFLQFVLECGYGFSYRVLDAQFVRTRRHARAVPQRRRRVFVVGYLGDWRRAAAVLLDPESLRGNPPPRRQARQGVAGTLASRAAGGGGQGTDFEVDGGLVAHSLTPARGRSAACDPSLETYIPAIVGQAMSSKWAKGASGPAGDEVANLVAHSLRAEGFDASEDGTGRGVPLIAFGGKDSGADAMENVSPTLRAGGHANSHANVGVVPAIAFDAKAGGKTGLSIGEVPGDLRGDGHGGGHAAVAYDLRGREGGSQFEGPHDTANIRAASGGSSRSYVAQRWAVRRLTPLECERLQGFPDGWTDIPYRGKPAADGPRYRALGNSMAVNVMAWIGERIAMVEATK